MQWLIEFAKIMISTIEVTSIFILTLSIFRFPIRYAFGKSVIIGCFLSIIGTIMRDWLHFYEYATLLMITSQYLLTMILFRLPAFFSLIFSATTYLVGTVLEACVALTGEKLGLLTIIATLSSVKLLSIEDLSVTILCFILTYALQKRKIGFSFIINRVTPFGAIKGYNFIISFLILCIVFIMQIHATMLQFNKYTVIFSLLYFFLLLVFIFVAYKQNRNQLKEKYERFATTPSKDILEGNNDFK